jgi:hypothetical protein
MTAPKPKQRIETAAHAQGKVGAPKKWTDERIEQEADALLEWAKKKDSLVIATFYGMRGISYQRAEEWDHSNEKFAESKRIAKTIIGARREHGALTGKLDASMVKASMANYDPEHRRYMLEMKAANTQNTAPKSIVFSFSGRDNDENAGD